MSVSNLKRIIYKQDQEIKHYKEMINILNIHSYSPEYLKDYFDELKAENKLLKECVEFYADETCDWSPYGYEVLDSGKLARETLAKIKGDE